MLAGLPFEKLAPRLTEAVCLVSPDQDQWAVAQSAFTLAKLAGADMNFQWSNDPLRAADVYLLPSISGTKPILRRRWLELLASGDFMLTLRPTRADVLAADADGKPVFTRCALGKGQVFFLAMPLERTLANTPGAFEKQSAFCDAWKIYARIFAGAKSQRVW